MRNHGRDSVCTQHKQFSASIVHFVWLKWMFEFFHIKHTTICVASNRRDRAHITERETADCTKRLTCDTSVSEQIEIDYSYGGQSKHCTAWKCLWNESTQWWAAAIQHSSSGWIVCFCKNGYNALAAIKWSMSPVSMSHRQRKKVKISPAISIELKCISVSTNRIALMA